MKLEDLVGSKSGNREQFKDAFRHFLAQFSRLGCDPVRWSLVMISAIASPMPGISVSVPAAIMRSKGCERVARLSAALR